MISSQPDGLWMAHGVAVDDRNEAAAVAAGSCHVQSPASRTAANAIGSAVPEAPSEWQRHVWVTKIDTADGTASSRTEGSMQGTATGGATAGNPSDTGDDVRTGSSAPTRMKDGPSTTTSARDAPQGDRTARQELRTGAMPPPSNRMDGNITKRSSAPCLPEAAEVKGDNPRRPSVTLLTSERSSSRSRALHSRVERRIEATLAKEAPLIHARSRKSSHYMGLFRQNEDSDSRPPTEYSKTAGTIEDEPKARPESQEFESAASSEGVDHRSKSDSEILSHPSEMAMPARLLEEIRDHHNLSLPFNERFKTSHVREAAAETKTPAEEEEQISSALYFPHARGSPDTLNDVEIETARAQKLTEPLEPLPDAALADEVNVNLQAHNQTRCLRGDLPTGPALRVLEWSSSTSESDTESFGYASLTDETDVTPKPSPRLLPTQESRHKATEPLGAVELKPYNHQVGGHTTVFRFSKRAVCKQLTSRENRFYETIENHHPELLKFVPK